MKNFSFLILLGLVTFFILSCEDSESYDIKGDAQNRLFINTQTSYVNEIDFNIIHTPIGNLGDEGKLEFPVRTTMPLAQKLDVTLAMDNALIDEYNSKHGTAFKPVPQGAIEISNLSLSIPQGQNLSSDSLSFVIKDYTLLTEEAYLVPIKIKSTSNNSDVEISNNLNTVYIKIKTLRTNTYNAPTSVTGTQLTNRTGWTATVTPTPSSGAANNMFTTSTSQYWTLTPARECEILVDMVSAKSNIRGIIMTSTNNYRILKVETLSSMDGTNWESQGISTVSNSNNQYIRFYEPITARYLKVKVLEWQNNSNIRVITFLIYQ